MTFRPSRSAPSSTSSDSAPGFSQISSHPLAATSGRIFTSTGGGTAGLFLHRKIVRGQVNGESRSFSYFGLEVDGAFAFLDEPVHDGEPQTGAFVGGLGCKKRLK